ncbi:MAG: hypothetical protein ABFS42_02515 [Candidatus Krumholzibacteriota bacterium]
MIDRGHFAIVNIAFAMGLTLLLAACTSTSEPDPGLDQQRTLVGVWVYEGETDDGAKVFMRAAALTGNRPGYEFSEHGGLIVRTAGWCGTPKTWLNQEGLWSRPDDRLVDICHAARGGSKKYQLEIISLTSRRLTCRERNDDGS